MKKYIISFLAFLAALSLTSCSQDKLDIPQKGVISIDDYYQTEDDAEGAALNVYTAAVTAMQRGNGGAAIYAPYFMLFNYASDDAYAAGSNRGDNDFLAQVNEYRAATTNEVINHVYQGFYRIIYAANLVTDHFSYGKSDAIDRNISEARVFRAWAHMMLAMGWNNPPKIDKVLSGSARPGNCDHAELLAWCIQELDEASAYLPSRKGKTDKDGAVRLTKEAALAFEGKAQVYAGDYSGAKTTLLKVINSNNYELVSGEELRNNFHLAGDGNAEKIFEFNAVENKDISFWTQVNYSGWMMPDLFHWRTDKLTGVPTTVRQNGWGNGNPTGEFAKALIANDGMDSYRRQAWILTYDEFLTKLTYPSDFDENGNNKNLTYDQKMTDPLRGIDPNKSGFYGNEGYFIWKTTPMLADQNTSNTLVSTNTLVMRYAEVLLLYAEACARTSDNDGLKYLQMIQNRAGSDHVSTTLTLDEVKNEKRFEMWLEECRFIDLVRWGDAPTALANNGKAIPIFRDLIGTNGNTKHTGFVDWSESAYNKEYGFKVNVNEYFPYPYSETSINPNIIQNPGW